MQRKELRIVRQSVYELLKRAILISLCAAAVLLVVYAALGYLLAPRLVRNVLVEQARQAGYELQIGTVRSHPFALSVDLLEVRVDGRDGLVAHAGRASADLAWSSVLRRRWTIERAEVEQGALSLRGFPRLEDVQLVARDVSAHAGRPATFEARGRIAGGGSVESRGSLALAPLAVQGALSVEAAPLAVVWTLLPQRAAAAPDGTLAGTLDYRYADGRVALERVDAKATAAKGGALVAQGNVTLKPLRARLRLQATELPLALLEPLVPSGMSVAGALSGEGTLEITNRVRYAGSASVANARLEHERQLLLGWQRLATRELELDFSPFALRAGEVLASAPRGRLAIDEQGRLNVTQIFHGSGKGGGARPSVEIARLRVENGMLDFSDRSLPSPFGTTVHELAGSISGIGTRPGQAAEVVLDGRVGQYGEARVRGSVDLDAPSALTDLRARLRNLALRDFTPYAAKFAGYRIDAGRLSADLRYRVREGRLVGTNQLAFQELKLGERVQSASALDLPIELAVALLTDANGRINLAIPVSGDLNDPHFDIGGLVAKAVGNTLGRIVFAPFRMLASLAGRSGDERLDELGFDPGAAGLSPPAEEAVARIATALDERPQLALVVRPGYDSEADARALRRRTVLADLAKRAGYGAAAGGTAPPAAALDPKIVFAAERLYLERGASARDLLALHPRERGYGNRLVERLSAAVPLAPQALQDLASARAAAIRDALAGHGVGASRVRLASPEEVKAGEAGIATRFSLASAASRAAPPESRDAASPFFDARNAKAATTKLAFSR